MDISVVGGFVVGVIAMDMKLLELALFRLPHVHDTMYTLCMRNTIYWNM